MGWEQPQAVSLPLCITKSVAKTHCGDQTPFVLSGGEEGAEALDPHQPAGGSSPDSPMMAWTRTESCVRRMRVGRLPFLGWGETTREHLPQDHHHPQPLARGPRHSHARGVPLSHPRRALAPQHASPDLLVETLQIILLLQEGQVEVQVVSGGRDLQRAVLQLGMQTARLSPGTHHIPPGSRRMQHPRVTLPFAPNPPGSRIPGGRCHSVPKHCPHMEKPRHPPPQPGGTLGRNMEPQAGKRQSKGVPAAAGLLGNPWQEAELLPEAPLSQPGCNQGRIRLLPGLVPSPGQMNHLCLRGPSLRDLPRHLARPGMPQTGANPTGMSPG